MGDSYRPNQATRDSYRPSQQELDRRPEISARDQRTYDSWRASDTLIQPGKPIWDQWRPNPTRPAFDSSKYRSQASNNPPSQQRATAPPASNAGRQIHSSARSDPRYNLRAAPKQTPDDVLQAQAQTQANSFVHRPKQPQPQSSPHRRRGRAPSPETPGRSRAPHSSTPETPTGPRSRRSSPPTIQSGATPKPTPAYLAQAVRPSVKLLSPQPLLLVIDLNGTLILRSRSNNTGFVVRSNALAFISNILAKYTVMIWSSAQPKNVDRIVEKLLSKSEREKLIAVWGRDKLDLSKKMYKEKVQVYKRLHKVWGDKTVQSMYPGPDGGKWDQTNTILIDDSKLKAATQPYNLIEIPEFVDRNEHKRGEPPVLDDVTRMLEILSFQEDVSRFLRVQSAKESFTNVEKGDEGLVGTDAALSDTGLDEESEVEGGIELVPQEVVGDDGLLDEIGGKVGMARG